MGRHEPVKLLRCNGRVLEVIEVGPVVFRLAARNGPIKLHGVFVVDDQVADEWVRQLAEAQSPELRVDNAPTERCVSIGKGTDAQAT
jgi:hypothetical protein